MTSCESQARTQESFLFFFQNFAVLQVGEHIKTKNCPFCISLDELV